VDADRRARLLVRGRCGGEGSLLEGRQEVVARAELDHPAAREVRDEALRERVDVRGAERAVVLVVGVTVQARRSDHVQPRRLRDRDEPVEVPAETERRPLDERRRSRGDERPRLLGRRGDVVELLPRLQRRRQEEVLVRIAGAKLPGSDVAPDRADDPRQGATGRSLRGRANSASAASSSISAAESVRWKTSSIAAVHPKMK